MKRFLVPLILSLVALAAGLIPTASALAAPANDNLASAQVVGPALPITEAGTTVGATVEAGELDPGDGHSVWFSWTAPAAGPVRVDVCDYEVANGPGNFGLWVYTGNTIATLVEVGSSPNGCKVSFPAISGTAYRIAFNSFFEGEGNFTLRLSAETPPPNDNFSSRAGRRARPADIADRLECLLHGRGRRAPPRERRRNRLPGARQRLVHVDTADDDRCPDQGLRREHRPSPRRLHGSGGRRPDQSHADRPDRHASPSARSGSRRSRGSRTGSESAASGPRKRASSNSTSTASRHPPTTTSPRPSRSAPIFRSRSKAATSTRAPRRTSPTTRRSTKATPSSRSGTRGSRPRPGSSASAPAAPTSPAISRSTPGPPRSRT